MVYPCGMQARLSLAAAALTATIVVLGPTAIPRAADRPTVAGPNGAVSAGHPLTSAAAFEVLLKGGNAFDAGVAAMLVGGVVEQDLYSLGGEGLVLVYSQRERKVTSIVGQGWAPKGATIDWYTSRGKNLNGIGLDPAVVPGTVHAALTVLERWGTMTFEQVSMRAIEYAQRGFPLRPRTAAAIDANRKFIESWPDNKRTWLKPDGAAYKAGDTIQLPDLARTLSSMVDAERKARKKGRGAGIAAARDRFYKGDIAREMVAFLKEHRGAVGARRFLRVLRPGRAARDDDLSWLRGLQAVVRQPGPGAARGAQYPRAVRPPVDEAQQRSLPAHRGRGTEACLRGSRQLLRRPGIRSESGRGSAVKGVRERTRPADRRAAGVERLSRRRPAPFRFEGQELELLDREPPQRRRSTAAAAGGRT